LVDRELVLLSHGGGRIRRELARIQEAHLYLMFGEPERALERSEEAERFRARIFANSTVTYISFVARSLRSEDPLGHGAAVRAGSGSRHDRRMPPAPSLLHGRLS
jgi:hypothetical protein